MSGAETQSGRNPRIVGIDGPLEGRVFPLVEAECSVGRERGCTIQVADRSVSRTHCRIVRDKQGAMAVEDCDSRNGTFVNGVPVKRRPLEDGDQLRLGACRFLFLVRVESDSRPSVVLRGGPSSVTRAETHLRREDAYLLGPEDALEPARDSRRVAHNLKTLLRISGVIRVGCGLDEMAGNLIEVVAEAIPATEAAILLFDPGGLEPVWSCAWRLGEGMVSELTAPEEIVRRCLLEDVAVLSNQPPEALPEGDPGVEEHPAGSILTAPLRHREGTGGVFYLGSRDETISFDSGQLQLLTAIGAVAGFALDGARQFGRLQDENRRLRQEIDLDHDMVGESPAMQTVYRSIAKLARTGASVLISGESGTGKELVARAIHRNSERAEGPFVAVNCAALPEKLAESELFGHESGAFTDARGRKQGKFEAADGGTIFLDEIGEMPLELQVKLLRVLQEREFDRLGGTRPIRVDVRVLAATNRHLRKETAAGRFREDLFFRLNVVNLRVPPLRERSGDIALLVRYFVARIGERVGRRVAGIRPPALRLLLGHAWPGNVRELENAIERAIVLGSAEYIEPEDLPEDLLDVAETAPDSYHEAVREAKRAIIREALQRAGGRQVHAARLLSINPAYLSRLIRTLDVKPSGAGANSGEER